MNLLLKHWSGILSKELQLRLDGKLDYTRCSVCYKDLSVGLTHVKFYLPPTPGLTGLQPEGHQCSHDCYVQAVKDKIKKYNIFNVNQI